MIEVPAALVAAQHKHGGPPENRWRCGCGPDVADGEIRLAEIQVEIARILLAR